jgi:hypothetical protein
MKHTVNTNVNLIQRYNLSLIESMPRQMQSIGEAHAFWTALKMSGLEKTLSRTTIIE